MYYTQNWEDAEKSVEVLDALEPELVITGHGRAPAGSRNAESAAYAGAAVPRLGGTKRGEVCRRTRPRSGWLGVRSLRTKIILRAGDGFPAWLPPSGEVAEDILAFRIHEVAVDIFFNFRPSLGCEVLDNRVVDFAARREVAGIKLAVIE